MLTNSVLTLGVGGKSFIDGNCGNERNLNILKSCTSID
jgi:hypothetical protein